MNSKSVNETGHAKYVANFERMIVFCTAYGTLYNPSTAAIKLPALNALLTSAKSSMGNMAIVLSTRSNAVSARKIAFETLSSYCGRIVYALTATGISIETVNNARTHLRKIQGRRAKALPKNADPVTEPLADNTAPDNAPLHGTNSVSQMSFDSRIENFSKLIELVASEPVYSPNETDLKINSIKATLANLRALNSAAINAQALLSNARIARNKTLFAEPNGILPIAYEVKNYVKSVFGINSPEYKQISNLRFTRNKA
jgi:hypothetical protein